VRMSPFSNVAGTGDWSADILVRLCVMVNPKAHRRTRMSALQKNVRCAHSLISRLELGERRVDVVEFFWICQACGADPARTASSLMRQFAKIQAESPGDQ